MIHTFLLTASQTVSMSTDEKIELSLATTITGLVIVFAVLILLTFIFSMFGKLMQSAQNKGKKAAAKPAEPVVEPDTVAVIKAPPTATQADDDELLAVIAAAVYAYGQSSGKQYAIKSVKRSDREHGRRSAWANAGVSDNVRAF